MQTVETSTDGNVWTVPTAPGYNGRMADQWITTAEAAELADYTRNHIARLLKEGRVEGRKFGPVWQVNKESLKQYVAEQRAKGGRRGPKSD